MDILWELTLPETWQAFIQYKTEKQHLSPAGQRALEDFLAKGACVRAGELLTSAYVPPLPAKRKSARRAQTRSVPCISIRRNFRPF